MPAFTKLNLALAFALAFTARVRASLYPTIPIQHSILHGGQWNELKWKDSGDAPTLNNIGRIDIQLFVDHAQGIHLATLATDVDPTQRRQEVFIPSDIYENGNDFFIRFHSTDPPLSFWTADFTIDGLTGTSSSSSSTTTSMLSGSSAEQTSNPSENSSNLQSQNGNGGEEAKNGVVTVTMEMSGAPSSTSTSGNSASTSSVEGSSGSGRANTVSAVSSEARRLAGTPGELRNMRFNIVFGLFPALLGVIMAL